MKAPADQKPRDSVRRVATNRKAFRDYQVLDKIEAGIELRGAEVKSIRAGRFSIAEGYASIDGGDAILHGFHILPYECSRVAEQDPDRPKRLLLHKREIDRLVGQTAIKGHTIVPLQVYFKKGYVKVELGLCKGKHSGDKRETLRRRTAEREAERAMAARTRH